MIELLITLYLWKVHYKTACEENTEKRHKYGDVDKTFRASLADHDGWWRGEDTEKCA